MLELDLIYLFILFFLCDTIKTKKKQNAAINKWSAVFSNSMRHYQTVSSADPPHQAEASPGMFGSDARLRERLFFLGQLTARETETPFRRCLVLFVTIRWELRWENKIISRRVFTFILRVKEVRGATSALFYEAERQWGPTSSYMLLTWLQHL